MKRLSLVGRVVVLASAVAMVVVLVVAAALIAIISLRRAEARESRAKDVTAATLRVQSIAFDLESSLRGYTLSGSRRFLTRFNIARATMPGALQRLNALVGDDREQLRRALATERFLRAYVTDYAQPVITIRSWSAEVARSSTASDEDRRRTNEIRGTLGTILAVEQRRSVARSKQVRAVARSAVVVGSVALALSAGLVLLFGAWVARAVAAPVRRTSAAAARVAAGDFDVRLDEGGAGEVGALLGAFNSMTRALELGRRELLEQNDRLRESEQHKRDLISMVSHEIRTPLASVVGFTSLLLERDFPTEEQRRYLEIVDQQARRLAGLAGDFLDVQLLEGGGLSFDYAPFDLVDLASEQARLFFSHASAHTLDLAVPEDPVIVNADRDRIAQVIGNLLSNAIKYSPAGGRVRVLLEANERDARLSVADEGMGIPAADQARIFEKFFRGADAASAIGGTGLGLAVAREIVTSHGGRIDVESEPGRGSTFTVRLPRVSVPVSA
jgi:signal transduction histidine kinase